MHVCDVMETSVRLGDTIQALVYCNMHARASDLQNTFESFLQVIAHEVPADMFALTQVTSRCIDSRAFRFTQERIPMPAPLSESPEHVRAMVQSWHWPAEVTGIRCLRMAWRCDA